MELVDVTVRRGPNVVVRDLSLPIRSGRPFWIVGPNGAGKSSLLRVLAGLDRPARGRVRVLGRRRPLYAHSEMRLPGSATVRDWSRFARRVVSSGARPSGLWPAVPPDRRIGRLSTGERKRLVLDVLLRRSGPLILDEPFEHLSPAAKTRLAEALRRRAAAEVVVVATNQSTHLAGDEGGLHLEAGQALALGAVAPGARP